MHTTPAIPAAYYCTSDDICAELQLPANTKLSEIIRIIKVMRAIKADFADKPNTQLLNQMLDMNVPFYDEHGIRIDWNYDGDKDDDPNAPTPEDNEIALEIAKFVIENRDRIVTDENEFIERMTDDSGVDADDENNEDNTVCPCCGFFGETSCEHTDEDEDIDDTEDDETDENTDYDDFIDDIENGFDEALNRDYERRHTRPSTTPAAPDYGSVPQFPIIKESNRHKVYHDLILPNINHNLFVINDGAIVNFSGNALIPNATLASRILDLLIYTQMIQPGAYLYHELNSVYHITEFDDAYIRLERANDALNKFEETINYLTEFIDTMHVADTGLGHAIIHMLDLARCVKAGVEERIDAARAKIDEMQTDF